MTVHPLGWDETRLWPSLLQGCQSPPSCLPCVENVRSGSCRFCLVGSIVSCGETSRVSRLQGAWELLAESTREPCSELSTKWPNGEGFSGSAACRHPLADVPPRPLLPKRLNEFQDALAGISRGPMMVRQIASSRKGQGPTAGWSKGCGMWRAFS